LVAAWLRWVLRGENLFTVNPEEPYFLTSGVTITKKIAVPNVQTVQWFDRLTMTGSVFRSS